MPGGGVWSQREVGVRGHAGSPVGSALRDESGAGDVHGVRTDADGGASGMNDAG